MNRGEPELILSLITEIIIFNFKIIIDIVGIVLSTFLFHFIRTPSPNPPIAMRGPESLPRSTPAPPHSQQSNYQLPVQHEGEYRTLMLSPTSTRTDDTIDESINSQVSVVIVYSS